MPFLRLTRDRRGFENTYLLHAAHPGDKPRLLYWYRTAPGVGLGRPPLDEEAIRTLDKKEQLSLMERRFYRWDCGCNERRMMQVLAPTFRQDPVHLFGPEQVLRMSCPR